MLTMSKVYFNGTGRNREAGEVVTIEADASLIKLIMITPDVFGLWNVA